METPQQTSGLETRPWTKEEDQKLFECKSKNRHLSWPEIAMLTELERSRKRCRERNPDLHRPDIPTLAGLSRSGKSCTERWNNHLDPNVKRENFSQEEDDAIICFQSLYGNSWESIAAHLPGRTDNDVKNRWYNHLKKKKIGKISQEIANSWSTSELVYPEFAGDHLMSDDEIIHHSFGGDYF
ncbi:transcription factor MYB53-like [Vitis vinifera]|uniref:transcription factor MYB53-like n=1 Tax=Vitis vinifera TaxID=29760 RepID=UPI00023B284F|nr:transcription factor MYB53-like [Vitis vinifera]|eukprot:XP_019081453.1 PREDICTED: myb-related protein Myb4-like [Vitis vinifera]